MMVVAYKQNLHLVFLDLVQWDPQFATAAYLNTQIVLNRIGIRFRYRLKEDLGD
jgi:hypothetical protein